MQLIQHGPTGHSDLRRDLQFIEGHFLMEHSVLINNTPLQANTEDPCEGRPREKWIRLAAPTFHSVYLRYLVQKM